jgi:hypothetical protein
MKKSAIDVHSPKDQTFREQVVLGVRMVVGTPKEAPLGTTNGAGRKASLGQRFVATTWYLEI